MTKQPDPQEDLREAIRDLAYTIANATGLLRLAERLGYQLKPWVKERQR